MNIETFNLLVERLGSQGADDIAWSEGCRLPDNADDFALEAVWVILNSGMKNTVARGIFERVRPALFERRPVRDVFGHPGKAAAIETIWRDRSRLYDEFREAEDKLAYCAALPWIGEITKFHLAKNWGEDFAKPDVHLVRVAERAGTDAHALCAQLARESGYRVGTIDLVIWRACATGLLDSRTGALRSNL